MVATNSGTNLMGSWTSRRVANAVKTLLAVSGVPRMRHVVKVAVDTQTGVNQNTHELYALRKFTADNHFNSASRKLKIRSLNFCSQAYKAFLIFKPNFSISEAQQNSASSEHRILTWHGSHSLRPARGLCAIKSFQEIYRNNNQNPT